MKFRTWTFSIFAILLPLAGYAQDPQRVDPELPDGVAVQRDLEYAKYDDRRLLLDLYLPEKRNDAPLPTIVAIRGGGWFLGDKEGFGAIAAALAKRGFAAVSIEYRASGEAPFPAAVEDTKAAVRWVRAHAKELKLDPDAIGAIGGSAGAHLALFLATTAGEAEFEGAGGNPGASSAISAVVALATPGDLLGLMREHVAANGEASAGAAPNAFLRVPHNENPELWRKASPLHHIGESSPPALLIHSEADPLVPFTESVKLAGAFGECGVAAELVLLPDAPHAFWHFDAWFDDTMDRAARFFDEHLPPAR